MAKAFVGIGSNLGDKRRHCERALDWLMGLPQTRLKKTSSYYLTQPQGLKGQPWFINLVALLDTKLSCQQLFGWLKKGEQTLGRFPTCPQGPRIIDLDLLLYENTIVNSRCLTVPHPRLHQRRFVLAPLVEISEEEVHPVLQMPLKAILKQLPTNQWVIKIK